MKILIYTHNIPYPLNEGGKVAQFTFIRQLIKHGHTVILIAKAASATELGALKNLGKIFPEIKVCDVNDAGTAKPKSMLHKVVSEAEWRLHKRYMLANPVQDAIELYYAEPVSKKTYSFLTKVKEIIDAEAPDIVQVDFTDNADMVDVIETAVSKTVLVTHELKYISLKQILTKKKLAGWYVNHVVEKRKAEELYYYKKYDQVIVFSENDENKLRSAGIDNVMECFFAVPDENFVAELMSGYQFKKLVFIGPESHMANADAIDWYVNFLGPQIFTTFGLRLEVLGKWSETTIKKYEHNQFIIFRGFVDDLQHECNDAVMVVPIRIGSGIRTKILDSLSMGVPVISTSLGCEGIGLINGENVLLAENPEEFCFRIGELSKVPDMLDNLRKKGYSYIREYFSETAVYNKRIEIYKRISGKE